MKALKRSISILLCLLTLFGSAIFFVTADAATDDGWTTKNVSCNDDGNTKYTVSAKGNNIKIVIKSSFINDDKLFCAGTKDAPESENWGKADGTDIFYVFFADTTSEAENTNRLIFKVEDACGEDKESHYISASKEARYNLQYYFYRDDKTDYVASVGQYYNSAGKLVQGDYKGKMSECKKLKISVSGDTMTVTTTLPDEVVDFYKESKRNLAFDSEKLIVSGHTQGHYYQTGEVAEENTDFVNELITKAKEVFRKFFELLRKFFTFDFI